MHKGEEKGRGCQQVRSPRAPAARLATLVPGERAVHPLRRGRRWEFVSALLKDPERLRAGLEELIEQERAGMRGDPDREANTWLEKLAEVDQERRGYLRLAAKGHMSDDDLAEALAELEETRATADRELEAIRARKAAIEELERDRDALLASYAGMMPEALDSLAPEERTQIYRMLRLRVDISADGTMQAQGVLSVVPPVCENGVASTFTASWKRTGLGRRRRA